MMVHLMAREGRMPYAGGTSTPEEALGRLPVLRRVLRTVHRA